MLYVSESPNSSLSLVSPCPSIVLESRLVFIHPANGICPRKSAGCTARTRSCVVFGFEDPTGVLRARLPWAHTTTGFGAKRRVLGQARPSCVGRTLGGLLWIKNAADRGTCCPSGRQRATLVTRVREGKRRWKKIIVCDWRKSEEART